MEYTGLSGGYDGTLIICGRHFIKVFISRGPAGRYI
jgi:hypothetical protein